MPGKEPNSKSNTVNTNMKTMVMGSHSSTAAAIVNGCDMGAKIDLGPTKTYCTPISVEKNGEGNAVWVPMFGEIFCIVSYILAADLIEDSSSSSILIHSSNIKDSQTSEIRKVYFFFLAIFNANHIVKSKILLDEKAVELIGDISVRNKFTLVGKYARGQEDKKWKFTYESKVVFLPKEKKKLTDETVQLLMGKELNFDDGIASALSEKDKHLLCNTLVDEMKGQVNSGISIILTLRRKGDRVYDKNHQPYYYTTKSFILGVIKFLSQYNKSSVKNGGNSIANVFIVGSGYEDESFFSPGGEPPRQFIEKSCKDPELNLINCKFIASKYWDHLSEKVLGDESLHYLACAYYIIFIKNQYHIKFAIGPFSGITHALASFGISIIFPSLPKSDGERFDIKNSNYFQVNMDEVIKKIKDKNKGKKLGDRNNIIKNIFDMDDGSSIDYSGEFSKGLLNAYKNAEQEKSKVMLVGQKKDDTVPICQRVFGLCIMAISIYLVSQQIKQSLATRALIIGSGIFGCVLGSIIAFPELLKWMPGNKSMLAKLTTKLFDKLSSKLNSHGEELSHYDAKLRMNKRN